MTVETRELTVEQVNSWAEDRAGVVRLHTDRDLLPGGYLAALAPMLVSWPATEVTPERSRVTVRNVNYGGSPFERITVLQSVILELEAVESAELILVPSNELGRRNPVHHVQLRFIFESGREPVLAHLAGAGSGSDPRVPDLVLSWETWHPPGRPYNLLVGLDERAYGLSLRAYTGAQRYLEDTIRRRKWYAYPLRMPGGRVGLKHLLGIALALGDGVARDTLAKLLEAGEERWLAHAPADSGGSTAAHWKALRERMRRPAGLEDRLPSLPEGDESYHALIRSCATLSRYVVLLAAQRTVALGEAGDFDAERLPEPALGEVQPWMREAASSSLAGLFLRAPRVLRFLLRHPEAVPGRLPAELDAAGLLERRDGKRVEIVYARGATRPYGSAGIRRHE